MKEVTPNLHCNHSNTDEKSTTSSDIVKDALALHKEPINTRTSNRKKQVSTNQKRRYFMGISSNEVINEKTDAVYNRSIKFGKHLEAYSVHTNNIQIKKINIPP
jgi:hypothetical protein